MPQSSQPHSPAPHPPPHRRAPSASRAGHHQRRPAPGVALVHDGLRVGLQVLPQRVVLLAVRQGAQLRAIEVRRLLRHRRPATGFGKGDHPRERKPQKYGYNCWVMQYVQKKMPPCNKCRNARLFCVSPTHNHIGAMQATGKYTNNTQIGVTKKVG